MSKISEMREKVMGAFDDVPDNLISTVIFLTVLTAVVLGALMFFGYTHTNLPLAK